MYDVYICMFDYMYICFCEYMYVYTSRSQSLHILFSFISFLLFLLHPSPLSPPLRSPALTRTRTQLHTHTQSHSIYALILVRMCARACVCLPSFPNPESLVNKPLPNSEVQKSGPNRRPAAVCLPSTFRRNRAPFPSSPRIASTNSKCHRNARARGGTRM